MNIAAGQWYLFRGLEPETAAGSLFVYIQHDFVPEGEENGRKYKRNRKADW